MRIRPAIKCVGLAVFLIGFSHAAVAAPPNAAESTRLAVGALLKSQLPSGALRYGFDFVRDVPLESVDVAPVQQTRQGVTSSALADYLALTGDPHTAEAVSRLLAYFGKHELPIGRSGLQSSIAWTRIQSAPVGRWRIESMLKQYGLLYETEGPGKLLSPDSSYANAYAGATGLALLTEVRYSQATGDQRYAALRRAWLEGLMALRIPGDGFRQIPDSIDTHPYYDAEPWLALAEYRRAFPQDRRAAEFLADVDAALMKKYGEKFSTDFMHWGVMAAAVRYADTRDKRFLEFIETQMTEFLKRMERNPNNDNNCAAVEGVVDAMGALREGGEGGGAQYQRALEWTKREMFKAWRMQIEPGQVELVFANARIIAPRMQEWAGQFRNTLYTADTQVDTTGHCLSAMVKMKRQRIEVGKGRG